eukprot:tig00021073_g18067.t1
MKADPPQTPAASPDSADAFTCTQNAIRCKPVEEPKFAVDCMLGRTARLLRCAGFDAFFAPTNQKEALAAKAEDEGRVIITRDVSIESLLKRRVLDREGKLVAIPPRRSPGQGPRPILFSDPGLLGDSDEDDCDEDTDPSDAGLSRNRARSRNRALVKAVPSDRIPRVVVVTAEDARDQVDEILRALNVHVQFENLFSRCVKCCGAKWLSVTPEHARSVGISERTLSRVSQFWACGDCGCIFWEGRQFQGAMDWMTERLCRLDCGRGGAGAPVGAPGQQRASLQEDLQARPDSH